MTLEVVGTIQKINALVCLIVQACSSFRKVIMTHNLWPIWWLSICYIVKKRNMLTWQTYSKKKFCINFQRAEHRLSNGSRPWSTIHQDALVEIVKMNGENELQRLQPAVTDQLFIISQFILRDRYFFIWSDRLLKKVI